MAGHVPGKAAEPARPTGHRIAESAQAPTQRAVQASVGCPGRSVPEVSGELLEKFPRREHRCKLVICRCHPEHLSDVSTPLGVISTLDLRLRHPADGRRGAADDGDAVNLRHTKVDKHPDDLATNLFVGETHLRAAHGDGGEVLDDDRVLGV